MGSKGAGHEISHNPKQKLPTISLLFLMTTAGRKKKKKIRDVRKRKSDADKG